MTTTPTQARLAQTLEALSRGERETLQSLEFAWPGSLDFLTRLTGHLGCTHRPEAILAKLKDAVAGGLNAYREAARWADRARFKAFVEGLRGPLGEDAGLIEPALNARQRDIVRTENLSLYQGEPQSGSNPGA